MLEKAKLLPLKSDGNDDDNNDIIDVDEPFSNEIQEELIFDEPLCDNVEPKLITGSIIGTDSFIVNINMLSCFQLSTHHCACLEGKLCKE